MSLGKPSSACVVVEDLWYNYADDIVALCGIDLEIPDGAFVAILGQNGSGKTTLVKHFNGLLRSVRGRVSVFGQDTRSLPVGLLARQVGYVFQNPDYQIFCPTVREEIAFGPSNLGLPADEVRQRTEAAMAYFGLSQYAEAPPAVLGFGLRRKISIASIYTMRPRVFILDEPTVGLDRRLTLDVMHLVQDMHRQGHTILLVTHDVKIAAEFAELTLVLHDGRVLLYDDTRAVFGQVDLLLQSQIEPPQISDLARQMQVLGMPADVLTVQECFDAYQRLRSSRSGTGERP
ncbi:MAG: ABC transporter ATP-binding protein [Chloroflexi bacterium]|nr:ABC transporter ATP-binding protein [Chloroflexota bacterium]